MGMTANTPLRDALDALAEAFPVDEISDAPWVVERGSIAWMILEGEHGPQVGNFILEADARWVAAARNAIEAEAAAPTPAAPDVDVLARWLEGAYGHAFRGVDWKADAEEVARLLRERQP